MSIFTRSDRVPTPDERRAQWAYRYAMGGYHRKPRKPRIRLSISTQKLHEPRKTP
jgi:hypothetical protein